MRIKKPQLNEARKISNFTLELFQSIPKEDVVLIEFPIGNSWSGKITMYYFLDNEFLCSEKGFSANDDFYKQFDLEIMQHYYEMEVDSYKVSNNELLNDQPDISIPFVRVGSKYGIDFCFNRRVQFIYKRQKLVFQRNGSFYAIYHPYRVFYHLIDFILSRIGFELNFD